MATTSILRVFYLSYLSSPPCDRPIYRAIRRQKARRILELGIADGRRATRMIEVARRFHPAMATEFTGLDLFESRSATDGPGMTLKAAYRLLGRLDTRVRLIPGDPFSVLSKTANLLGHFDLVIVSARLDPASLSKAWFYMPRLLHEGSQVFQEELLPDGPTQVRLVERQEVKALAAAARGRRAA